jgi:hypothetical protein
MPEPIAEPKIADITGQYSDLNPQDRVYRSVSGYVVKIYTKELPPHRLGDLYFRITGSLCDPATGKAVMLGDVPFIIEHHDVGRVLENPDYEAQGGRSLESELLDGHQVMVRRVEQAAINHDAHQAISFTRKLHDASFGDLRLPAPST